MSIAKCSGCGHEFASWSEVDEAGKVGECPGCHKVLGAPRVVGGVVIVASIEVQTTFLEPIEFEVIPKDAK